jgi:hypothetical protein
MHDILIPNKTPETTIILSPQEVTGGFETVAVSNVGDKRLYHRRQTVGGILNAIERQKLHQPKWDSNRSLRHVACVPELVMDLWDSMGITADDKEFRKALMRHPEYMIVEQELRK